MAEKLSYTQSIALWVQTIAIVLAGIWAAYEFVFKEQQKSLHINPNIEASVVSSRELGGKKENHADDAKRRYEAVTVKSTVHNTSASNLYVVAGFIKLLGHKAKIVPENSPARPVSSGDYAEYLDMSGLDWQTETRLLGTALSFTGQSFTPNEKSDEHLVFFIPSDEYDILEVRIDFLVVDHCTGIYPFESCNEFFVEITPDNFEGCESTDEIDENDWCYTLYVVDSDSNSSRKVEEDDEAWRDRIIYFSSTQMLTLPGAPLLKRH